MAVHKWNVFETEFISKEGYETPFRDVKVNCIFKSPSGREVTVEAFWDGGDRWRVRFMPDEVGRWTFRTVCSNMSDKGLHGQRGIFKSIPYDGDNPLYIHGPLMLSENRRYLVHADGSPFFWLVDTAWNGVIKSTLDEWCEYLDFRRRQGFTAVQFIMTHWRGGLCDIEGEKAYEGKHRVEKLNVCFFKRIDAKFSLVNKHGLVAVPVLLWAFSDDLSPCFNLLEEDAVILTRYPVARYGAYILVWILAGDGDYRSEKAERWRRIGRALFHGEHKQLVTMHPAGRHWILKELIHERWFDIVGYQSGHGVSEEDLKWLCFGPPSRDWKLNPPRPIINLEPNYEMHLAYGTCEPIDAYMVRRVAYWSLLVSPTAGVSYGTNGVWYWTGRPEIPINHPNAGVAKPWRKAICLPGAEHMSRLKEIFLKIPWWLLQPDACLLMEQPGLKRVESFVAASRTVNGRLAVIYTPIQQDLRLNLTRLEKPVNLTWINPCNGEIFEEGLSSAEHVSVKPPGKGDWILILRSRD